MDMEAAYRLALRLTEEACLIPPLVDGKKKDRKVHSHAHPKKGLFTWSDDTAQLFPILCWGGHGRSEVVITYCCVTPSGNPIFGGGVVWFRNKS